MDWVIVEVVVGLSFLFFLLSIIASAVSEAIAGIFKLRARTLEHGIVNLVTGAQGAADADGLAIVRQLYEHSLVNGYGEDQSKPSYLSSRSFRNALFDVTDLLETTAGSGDPLQAEAIRAEVDRKLAAIPSENLEATLRSIWRSVYYDVSEFRAGVERWFDRGMERVSGWYRRRAQVTLGIVGLLVAILLNANALQVADRLWQDNGLREGLVAQIDAGDTAAEGAASADPAAADSGADGAAALERLEELGFPVGWEAINRPDGGGEWVIAVMGWIVTAVAVSFGASFWFDLLGKVANLRSAGRKPDSVLTPAPTKTEVSEVRLSVSSEPPRP